MPVKRRSCDLTFDIRRDCLCTSRGSQKDKQFNITAVQTLEYLDGLKERIIRRNDSWGQQVLSRVSNFNDLVAAEAKYHWTCMTRFYIGRKLDKNLSRAGRPPDEKRQELFEKCCDYIEENDECQYSLRELRDIINLLNDDDSVSISENWLQAKLGDHCHTGSWCTQHCMFQIFCPQSVRNAEEGGLL